MNTFSFRSALLACVCFLSGMSLVAAPTPGGGGNAATVTYNPDVVIAQGNQPLDQSYPLEIKSPSNLVDGTSVTVALTTSVLYAPTGVDAATALSFLSLSSYSVTFTGPSQKQTITVSVKVPLGNYAGNYAYRIQPTGWPANLSIVDTGCTVNSLVSPPLTQDTSAPAIVLNRPKGETFTYYPVTGVPVTVPITFDATVGTGGQPITGLQAFVNGTGVTVTSTGIGTLAASGTASIDLTDPGTYAVRVTATNQNGTSEDNGDFSIVVSAPAPTITVSSPAANATYTFPTGGTGVTVPISYTATSQYGNITATDATLNGSPIPALSISGVGTALTATGSVTLNNVAAGTYVLHFTASNSYGDATPVDVPFTVQSVDPIPTATILTPTTGTVITRTEGDPATVVNYTFSGGTNFGSVQSVTVLVDGTAVTPTTVTGIGTTAVAGSGSLSYSAAGTHTITLTVSNGFSTATDTTTFTIDQQTADICAYLTWLPPISLNKTVEGGSVVPIKFRLDCHCQFVRDETVLISIYEIYADGSMSDPVIYPYGAGSPNPSDYAITGPMYHLNYPTADGIHHYRIEVYHPRNAEGTSLQLLGTKDLITKEAGPCVQGQHDDHNWGCDKSGKDYGSCDKSGKDYGSGDKSGKDYGSCDKSGKDYGDNSGKSYDKGSSSQTCDSKSSSSSSSSSWNPWGGWGWCW